MKRAITPLFLLWLMFLLGCNRTIINKPIQVPYSPGSDTSITNSNEAIDSFVITAADNPGVISADVKGSIFFDTIRLDFERGTNVSNLVPTIGIAGMSIAPASKTPENFDNTVHYILTADDGAILNYYVVAYFR